MQTIRVDINDNNIFNTIMDFLNNLPQHEFRVKVEKRPSKTKGKKLKATSLKTKGFTFDRDEAHAR